MKSKSLLILLITIIVIAGLAAVSVLGVGSKKATASSSSAEATTSAPMQAEPETNENGEPVTTEDGKVKYHLVSAEATTEAGSETGTDAATETTTAQKNPGYGSYKNIKLGLDLKGGVYIVYQADKANPTEEEMNAAVSMLQERVAYKGWYDAEVSKENTNRIRVEIPGVEDAAATANEIGTAAHLTFKDENGNVLVDGENVKNAGKAFQNNQVVVTLDFDSEGTKKFADATQANLNKRISIYMDDMLLSSPTVNSAITDGKAIISGDFDNESAETLAAQIRAGSLPFSLNIVDYNEVGARLGAEALQTSVFGGAIGILLVFLFMLIVYRVCGLAADLALAIYIGLIMFIMSLFGVTLTLPGVAGIVLSVGMAVDANVIIFERIKEEINLGKSIKTSIKNGFSKALSAILDGNITTLITCAVLLWLGTGPIKGFAQTLMLGIVLSMFTALVITRIILNALLEIGLKNPKMYGGK